MGILFIFGSMISGIGGALILLFAALQIFMGRHATSVEVFIAFGFCASIPAAAWVSGILADSYLRAKKFRVSPILASIMPLGAAALFFSTGGIESYVGAVLGEMKAHSPVSIPFLVLTVGNTIIFVGAVSALSLMILVTITELPARWFLGAIRGHSEIPFDAIRHLLYIFAGTIGGVLMTGLYSHELWPASIFLGG